MVLAHAVMSLRTPNLRVPAVLLLIISVAFGSLAHAQKVVTLADGFNSPSGVAVDAHGDVFVADTNNLAVKEILAVNGIIPDNPTIETLVEGRTPKGVAVDPDGGILFVDPSVQEVILEFANRTLLFGHFLISPEGLALDKHLNIFVADTGANAVAEVFRTGPLAGQTFYWAGAFAQPQGVAVDNSGDVFLADTGNNAVKEMLEANGSLPQNQSTILTLGTGFHAPKGVAVDGSGDVFVADTGNNAVKEIVAVNGSIATDATIRTLGNFSQPNGIALDARGDVYVTGGGTGAVYEVQPELAFSYNLVAFPSIAFGSSAATTAKLVTAENHGSETLTFTTSTGSPNFKVLTTEQNTCQSGIAPGGSCTLPVEFVPAGVGLHTDSLTLVPTSGPSSGFGGTIQLRGLATGIGDMNEGPLNFGTILSGTTETLPLTIANFGVPGSPTLAVSFDNPSYSLASAGTCMATGVASAQTCTLMIKFAPVGGGVHNAGLTLTPSTGAAASVVKLEGFANVP